MSLEYTLENITNAIAEVAATLPSTGKIIKMEFGMEAPIVYDGSVTPATVDNVDRDAAATIRMDYATFIALSEGKTSGPTAMMTGKLKVIGDMGAALGFQGIMDKVQQSLRG
jgi:putative sterol carrier protein